MVNLEEVFNRLRSAKELVYDCETSGLSWQRNHVVGHVLTFGPAPQDTYYLPVRHQPGGNIEGAFVPQESEGWDGSLHPIEPDLIKAIDRPDLHVVGHNLSFDLKFLFRLGLRFLSTYEDTMLNSCLLNEWQPSHSLAACAKLIGVQEKHNILDYIMATVPDARAGGPRAAMGHYWRLRGDDALGVAYAGGDGTTTWQVRDWQTGQLSMQELGRVHDIECRLIPVLARMTTRGLKIDEERLALVKGEVKVKLEQAKAALPSDFNSKAPTQVRALMEKNGFKDWPTTPKGAPSFPEGWLLTNPVGKQIVAARKYANILSSFINPMLETHLWHGRVHPEYNQLRGDEYGTVTGRLSSSNPNLQQIHKRNEELGRLFRAIFVPDDGMVWCSSDLRQCEPRLLAYYSRCQVFLDGFRHDPKFDPHKGVAKAVNASTWDGMSPAQQKDSRETGKRINQTLITGGGKGVLVTKYGIPADKIDKIWNDYFDALPEIRPFQKSAASRMASRGYVMSLLGRRGRREIGREYKAVNRLLQMGNADIVKTSMVLIDEYLQSEGDKANMINSVHDALDLQYRPGDEAIRDECLRLMVDWKGVISMDVPMETDWKEGSNWSEATYGA